MIEANPFPDVDNAKKNLHVTFFSGEPDADAARQLEATDFGHDRLSFRGREIYIAYKDGMGRSSSPSSWPGRSSASPPPTATGTRSQRCWRWLTA